ncbi:hypothetical protein Tco_0869147 [Tanacetum coccineum]
MRTCPPHVFESTQRSFNVALCSALERIVTASGPRFGDVLNNTFLASRLQSAGLQTKLIRHSGIVASGPTFDDALSCSKVFAEDIYGDHVVSCVGIICIKHCHNVVRDTLFDIYYRSGIPVDMLLYSYDGGLDVYVDLTGSSPLTQTGMADFAPGRAVINVAQRKRIKYEAKCVTIGYGFLPFSFSSLGELEGDAVTLLKRIRKFSMAQDIRARASVHFFNMIGFAVAKGVGA